jgi:hypothetical protein
MKVTVLLAVLLAIPGCRDSSTKAKQAESDKVLREARETIAEGKALVAAHDKTESTMKELEDDGIIAAALLFANCNVDAPDEELVRKPALLKPFLPRLRALDTKERCTPEQRELAKEILAAVKPESAQ